MIKAFLGVVAMAAPSAVPQAAPGVCIGDAFIAGMSVAVRQKGPDFTVDAVASAYGPVSVYVGCCSQVGDARVARFDTVDGVPVWRTEEKGGFAGYLAQTSVRLRGTEWVQQLHFFGAGLKGDRRDAAFFKRLSFNRGRREKCGRHGALQ